jgi:hypothetical protein
MVIHDVTPEASCGIAWQVEPEASAHIVHIVALPNGAWAATAKNAHVVSGKRATAKNMVLVNSVCEAS